MSFLELDGLLDPAQIWPSGGGDADTITVKVLAAWHRLGGDRRPTMALDHALVGGRPVLRNGRLSVRLEGIDAPELHAVGRRMAGAQNLRPRVAEARGSFRQSGARSAAGALRTLLEAPAAIPCQVTTRVATPGEAFDVYGRVVGVVRVRQGGRALNLNTWLLRTGWALPSIYTSLTAAEAAAIRRVAASSRAGGHGLWGQYAARLVPFDDERRFRGPATDAGPFLLPKLFRRQVSWWVGRECGDHRLGFRAWLRVGGERCRIVGSDQSMALADLLDSRGNVLVRPEDVVFEERSTRVRSTSGWALTRW